MFDTQGHRHTLRGRQGQTLVELLADNEAIIGEGDTRDFAHMLCVNLRRSCIYSLYCGGVACKVELKHSPLSEKRDTQGVCLPCSSPVN